ncbi:MAG: ectoine/hydroxyectoine ABC transporter permease subunit EhuC [Rhodobacteraceae bacterium]|nr:ectoine/hydroxyectoine ABC transporter permease subunit EhuC [Paracoccaceae bacterium]
MRDSFDLIGIVMPSLLQGATVTLQVAAQAGLLGLVVALVVGSLRTTENRLLRFPLTVYVEFFRGTSAFVQLYWAYFALPMIGVRLDPLQAGILVLALNVGAYGSEVVRGALTAIPRGQLEACRALGIPTWVAYVKVLIPQAMQRVVLPMGNLAIDLLKGTSLLSAIAVTELAFAARQTVSAFGNPMLIFGLVLLMYLVLAAPIAAGARYLNDRTKRYVA